jgi:hypothetical protein
VVKCWKILDIIKNEEACASFLPKALEDNEELILCDDVQLGDILNILPSK